MLWGALLAVVLFYVGRYVATDVYSAEMARRDSMEIARLEEVKFPASTDNMKVVYRGFTVYFNSRYQLHTWAHGSGSRHEVGQGGYEGIVLHDKYLSSKGSLKFGWVEQA